MRDLICEITGEWEGGTRGSGQISLCSPDGRLSIPAQLGGQGIGTNPEELLLAASVSCYMITLGNILQYRTLPFERIKMRSEANFSTGLKLSLKKLKHAPEVIVSAQTDETHMQAIRDCLQLAERACMVSNALRGNVEVIVDGSVTYAR